MNPGGYYSLQMSFKKERLFPKTVDWNSTKMSHFKTFDMKVILLHQNKFEWAACYWARHFVFQTYIETQKCFYTVTMLLISVLYWIFNRTSLKSIKFSPRYLLLGINFPKSLPSLKLCLISEQTCKRREFHVNFFFYLDSLSRIFTNHRTAGEGGGHFFNYSLPLPPASQTLRH